MKSAMPFIAATAAGILFSACVSDHAGSPASKPTVHSEIAPPDCTHFLKPLCNPNKTRWDKPEHAKARPITSLFPHGGRIYLSGGEWNANLGAWFFGAFGEDESGEDVTGGIYRCSKPSRGNVL